MNTKKSIQIINSLIGINNDRIEGYQTAAVETKDNSLIALFRYFTDSSAACKQELVAEIQQLGGKTEDEAPTAGNFFNTWMELKYALNGNNRQAVLSFCEYGEDKALDAYNTVLTNEVDFLTIEQHKMIYKQYVRLKSDHDKIKSVRDMELIYQN